MSGTTPALWRAHHAPLVRLSGEEAETTSAVLDSQQALSSIYPNELMIEGTIR